MLNQNKPPVIILDPGNFTPDYDKNLGISLMDRGWDVEWITSRHLFEPSLPPERLRFQEAFFRRLQSICHARGVHRSARRFVKGACYPSDLLRFYRQFRKRPPGVLHVQWSHFPWLDAALWGYWQKHGWKIVYTAHDVRPLDGTSPQWFQRALPAVFRRADAVVVHSSNGLAALESIGITNKVELLAPAPSLCSGPMPDRMEARKKLKLAPDQPVVLFFGFVKPYKGLNVLLRSLPAVRDAVGGARLIIAGEMMEPMRKYRNLIRELRIGESVHWFDRYIPSASVATYFAASDVVALPYLDASSSAVLLSAYSYGRPVIATTVGGLPELVANGKTGILVPPRDPQALSFAMIEMLGDPLRAAEMGLCGRQRLDQSYTWPQLAARLSSLYERLWNRNH